MKMGTPDLVLAAATTALEKLQNIPPSFWLKLGGCVLAIILVVVILRKVLNINKFLLGGAAFIICGLIWFKVGDRSLHVGVEDTHSRVPREVFQQFVRADRVRVCRPGLVGTEGP